MQVVRSLVNEGFTLSILTPEGAQILPATIPGSVHTDLIAAGIIGDIRISGSEIEQEWIRNTDSLYSAQIAPISSADRQELHFAGLDTLATISINGKVRLVSENMHRAYSLDISDVASDGFDLKIGFQAPLPAALQRQKILGDYPNPYEMPYNYFRKMACSFGWDWGPITGSSGIWREIELVQWDEGILDEVSVVADVVSDTPQLRVRTKGRGSATEIRITVSGDDAQRVFTSALGSDQIFSCAGLQLWHPRGFGPATLYQVKIELLSPDGATVDSHKCRVGFRSVQLDQSDFSQRQKFAIVVNGERVWAKGVNWIPDDPFPHRITKAQYASRIQDLYSVEVNAIRVWGGGIYESDDFYDLCDELGIVVWQDFLFACAAYPETPESFAEVAQEAREAITRLSPHPSLVLWCGGNECIEGFQHWGWSERLAGKPWGLTFYLETLPGALAEFDGSRPYIPGSPFSTLTPDVKDFSSGTNHIWDVWNDVGYQRYEEYAPSFAAEFGYNGPASWRTLTRSIGKENLDSQDADLATHQKAFSGMDKLAKGLAREFSAEIKEGAPWYFAAQLVQARAVEIGLKHFRSQYESCSGAILWQYNDMWPAISWAVLDSSSHRKLSWYAMREAYRPRFLHFSGPGRQLIIVNDSSDQWDSQLQLTLLNQAGEILESKSFEVQLAPRSQRTFALSELFTAAKPLDIDGFLVAQMDGIRVARRIKDTPVANMCAADLSVSAQRSGNSVLLKVKANCFIYELTLLPELVCLERVRVSQEMLTLLPGEEIEVIIETQTSEDAALVLAKVEAITWSLNRLMN